MASNRKKTMVTMIAAAMAAAMVIGGGSFAYLQSQSNTVTNKFNTNIVEVSAGETDLKEDNTKDYDIIPGKSDPKDPFVTIKNTVPAYLFVTINDTTDGLVQYEVDTDSWKKLPGYDKVYYRVVPASEKDENGQPKEQKYYVLKGGENAVVSYDAALENKDMVNADGTLKDGYALAFVGFGIQQEPFYVAPQGTGDVTPPTNEQIAAAVEAGALKAYKKAYNQEPVTDTEAMNKALNNAQPGDVVCLGDKEYTLDPSQEIPAGTTLNGQGPGNSSLKVGTTNGDGYKIKTPNVTLSNLTIDGSDVTSGGYKSVINIERGGYGAVIDNCVIKGGGGSTWNSSILVEGLQSGETVTVKNTKISGAFRGILRESCAADIYIDNCDIDAVYPFNVDGGSKPSKIVVTDSRLHGWTSYSNVDNVTFTNTEFSKGNSGYDNVAAYEDTTFDNCTFDSNFQAYAQVAGFTWNFNNCVKDGVEITAENFKTMFSDSDVWSKCTCYVNGEQVTAE